MKPKVAFLCVHNSCRSQIAEALGCNVLCPFLPCKHREDWGLDDPTGKSNAEFERTIKLIHSKMEDLQRRIISLTSGLQSSA